MPNLRKIAISAVVGMSFLVITTSAFAKTNDGVRPGWGYGDKNHIHIGPPGQSVVLGDHLNNHFSFSGIFTTGGNSANHNTNGVVTIITGTVHNVVSFVNSLGHNFFGA